MQSTSGFYQFNFFGGFEIRFVNSTETTPPIALAYDKGRAILAYLAMQAGTQVKRSHLAQVFWPDLEPEAGLSNLRLVLHDLKRKLHHHALPVVQSDRQSVCFELAHCEHLDSWVWHVLSIPEQIGTLTHEEILAIEMRIHLYRGQFLEGLSLPSCDIFEEWLQIQRQSLLNKALALCERLSQFYKAKQNYEQALFYARQFTELDPWSELGHQHLMRLYAENGQAATALSHFDYCKKSLSQELGLQLHESTQRLALDIQNGLFQSKNKEVKLKNENDERRQVTVLFIEFASQHEIQEVEIQDEQALALAQQIAQNILAEYKAHTEHKIGTGLLAYFGYPVAQEQAAQLAVECALAIRNQCAPICTLRIGIHTGFIIYKNNATAPDRIGITSELAMRIRLIAEANEILVSHSTQQLIEGYFAFNALGKFPMRGLQAQLDVYAVERSLAIYDRIQADRSLSHFIGREQELDLLHTAWQQVQKKHKKYSLVILGDAGIGKSRLIQTFKQQLQLKPEQTIELRGLVQFQHSPYHALIHLLERKIGIHGQQSHAEKFNSLHQYLVRIESHHVENELRHELSLLAKFLHISLPEHIPSYASSPQKLREEIKHWTIKRLLNIAATQAVLFIIEDLHWLDPSSLEILHELMQEGASSTLMFVASARKTFSKAISWKSETYVLPPLPSKYLNQLIHTLHPEINEEQTAHIIARSDGNPLYAEEMCKVAHKHDQIPESLNDLLQVSLERAGSTKLLLHYASVIGREFNLQLLAHLSQLNWSMLQQQLARLCELGIVQQIDHQQAQFKHVLLQEAAYQSLTKTNVQAIHARIAYLLEVELARQIHTPAESLAMHFEGAQAWQKAAHWYLQAGMAYTDLHANAEALTHYANGLKMVEKVIDEQEKSRLKLSLLVKQSISQRALYGYGSERAIQSYDQALQLCEHQQNSPDLFHALFGLWASASTRSGYPFAVEIAKRLLTIAEESQDACYLQQAHYALCNCYFWQGQFHLAHQHGSYVLAQADQINHARHIKEFGESAYFSTASHQAWTLWFLGFPDQALALSAQLEEQVKLLKHPFTQAYVLVFAAVLQRWVGNADAALRLSTEGLALAYQHDFPLWKAASHLIHGWAENALGNQAGLLEIQASVDSMRQVMGGVAVGFLAPLTQALIQAHQYQNALAPLNEAVQVSLAIGDAHALADLYRLQAQCYQHTGQEDLGKTALHQAYQIAQEQDSLTMQLRCCIDLAQELATSGQTDKAYVLLNEKLGQFSEGYTTPDLMQAQGLLDTWKRAH